MIIKFVLTVFLFTICSCTPCRCETKESIRNSLLKETPIGTPRDTVFKVIQKKYSADYKRWTANRFDNNAAKTNIGPLNICTYLTSIWTSDTLRAQWQFDEKKNLKDIGVDIFSDGP